MKAATREAEMRARKADATKENRAMMVVVVIRAMLFYFMENISLDIEQQRRRMTVIVSKLKMRTKQSKAGTTKIRPEAESVE